MAFATQQFEELANLYGKIAVDNQKKREHLLAKRTPNEQKAARIGGYLK